MKNLNVIENKEFESEDLSTAELTVLVRQLQSRLDVQSHNHQAFKERTIQEFQGFHNKLVDALESIAQTQSQFNESVQKVDKRYFERGSKFSKELNEKIPVVNQLLDTLVEKTEEAIASGAQFSREDRKYRGK